MPPPKRGRPRASAGSSAGAESPDEARGVVESSSEEHDIDAEEESSSSDQRSSEEGIAAASGDNEDEEDDDEEGDEEEEEEDFSSTSVSESVSDENDTVAHGQRGEGLHSAQLEERRSSHRRASCSASVLRTRNTHKSVLQQHETVAVVAASEVFNEKPMVELIAGSNVWYQGYTLKESANEAKIRFPGMNGAHREKLEWLKKNSSRIWRGSYKSSDWRHLGKGAWAPRSAVKPPRSRNGAHTALATTGAVGAGAAPSPSAGAARKCGSQRRHWSKRGGSKCESAPDETSDGTHAGGAKESHSARAGSNHGGGNGAGAATTAVRTASTRGAAGAAATAANEEEVMSPRPAGHGRPPKLQVSRLAAAGGTLSGVAGGGSLEHSERAARVDSNQSPNALDSPTAGFCDQTYSKCSPGLDCDVGDAPPDESYDPLARWFEVHFSELQHKGTLSSLPFGTAEAGVLPEGFALSHPSGQLMQITLAAPPLAVPPLSAALAVPAVLSVRGSGFAMPPPPPPASCRRGHQQVAATTGASAAGCSDPMSVLVPTVQGVRLDKDAVTDPTVVVNGGMAMPDDGPPAKRRRNSLAAEPPAPSTQQSHASLPVPALGQQQPPKGSKPDPVQQMFAVKPGRLDAPQLMQSGPPKLSRLDGGAQTHRISRTSDAQKLLQLHVAGGPIPATPAPISRVSEPDSTVHLGSGDLGSGIDSGVVVRRPTASQAAVADGVPPSAGTEGTGRLRGSNGRPVQPVKARRNLIMSDSEEDSDDALPPPPALRNSISGPLPSNLVAKAPHATSFTAATTAAMLTPKYISLPGLPAETAASLTSPAASGAAPAPSEPAQPLLSKSGRPSSGSRGTSRPSDSKITAWPEDVSRDGPGVGGGRGGGADVTGGLSGNSGHRHASEVQLVKGGGTHDNSVVWSETLESSGQPSPLLLPPPPLVPLIPRAERSNVIPQPSRFALKPLVPRPPSSSLHAAGAEVGPSGMNGKAPYRRCEDLAASTRSDHHRRSSGGRVSPSVGGAEGCCSLKRNGTPGHGNNSGSGPAGSLRRSMSGLPLPSPLRDYPVAVHLSRDTDLE